MPGFHLTGHLNVPEQECHLVGNTVGAHVLSQRRTVTPTGPWRAVSEPRFSGYTGERVGLLPVRSAPGVETPQPCAVQGLRAPGQGA